MIELGYKYTAGLRVTPATFSRRRERGGVHTRARRVNYRTSEGGQEDRSPSACAVDADNCATAACALARAHIAARRRNSTTELTESPEGRNNLGNGGNVRRAR